MSELKATPGPWRKANRNVNEMMMTFHGVLIGDVFVDVPTSNEKHDAHLIAAAPQLYDIVSRFVNYRESENSGVALEHNDRLLDDAMAALAKARGES